MHSKSSNSHPFSDKQKEEDRNASIEPPNPKRRVPKRHFFSLKLIKCKIIRARRGKTSNVTYQPGRIQASGRAAPRRHVLKSAVSLCKDDYKWEEQRSVSTPPIDARNTSSRLELHTSSENRSSVNRISDVLPEFLNEPLYEVNSVRFKLNK